MPRIFDNIEQQLLPAIKETLAVSERADFCVGYFNMRGWRQIDSLVEQWPGGEGYCCRILVGMQRLPHEELRFALSLAKDSQGIDQQAALRMKKKIAEEFRNQLIIGAPTNEDEAGLRRLACQLRTKKVAVKLFLRHPLHAKLYLLFRPDPINPVVGYLGSSNLTLSGLSRQGELNIDVLDYDACRKLAGWFEERWRDRWCLDISDELAKIIEESWAREEQLPPYYIYLKMAYHLSQEARAGLAEFRIPRDFGNQLFDFQVAAVKIAAHHLLKRGGVLIGDVVGLGKTLMATALARIFEDDHDLETLIICPKNLTPMWEDYREQYRLRARVLSLSQVTNELPKLRRYRLVLIDESHNLRNRNGKRYRAIAEYILENESRVVLLTATPYNKTYLDLSSQLRLFIQEDQDLGIRPEHLLREINETEFACRYQCSLKSIAAFEKSYLPDDWRELMRLFLVRRTRSFILDNYAQTDPVNGRKFLTFADGDRSYFPARVPRTLKFKIDESDPGDQYARLYADEVVDIVNKLRLPRYGLGNYIAPRPAEPPKPVEIRQLQALSRAGKRLMGFCRTNLFKRLESGGQAFLQSLERHILRNYIFMYAIEKGKPLPIGTQSAEMLDVRFYDEDAEAANVVGDIFADEEDNQEVGSGAGAIATPVLSFRTEEDYWRWTQEVYDKYVTQYRRRFKWLRPNLFMAELARDLESDARALLNILQRMGVWEPAKDAKLNALLHLLTERCPQEKILVFTQFADTARYLETQVKAAGISRAAGVTGDSSDPTALAWRFSPVSNNKRDRITPEEEIRILIATDVLSEGQNLQDCAIIVNYDLPWAIIRLIQRTGRVDRIGQKAAEIICYSFLPADGVERIIRLRARIRKRLRENAEVVGTDEAFFEDDADDQVILDLYNEKANLLDMDADGEVDLASYAYQIWKKAIDREPALEKVIPALPPVVYSTRLLQAKEKEPEGVLVYMRTAERNDALTWVDKNGKIVSQSPLAILRVAECHPETAPVRRHEQHHELVRRGVEHLVKEEKTVGGQLGRPSGARFRTYERLKRYAEEIKDTLFESAELLKVIDDLYRYPLRQSATDTLNRQLRAGIADEDLARLVIALREEDRLCLVHAEEQRQEPVILCSMGLFNP
jgi:hypothetical protein